MRLISARLVATTTTLVACVALAPPAVAQVVRLASGQRVGIVRAPASAPAASAQRAPRSSARGETQGPLLYMGGPLMLSSTTYAIFWAPAGHAFPAGYENTVVQYLQDLAATSTNHTTATNDWSIAAQYRDASARHIGDAFTLGGTLNDATAYPNAGLPVLNCPGDVGTNPCLSFNQLESEIQNDIAAQAWPTDPATAPAHQYLIFTPPNVDSCIDASSCTNSATGGFCGYHSSFRVGSSWVQYSNLPDVPGCASGQAPAGVSSADVDGTLDTLIHELLETATDPLPANTTSYIDSGGAEIADKCAGPLAMDPNLPSVYGTPLGGSLAASTAYNELMNGHQYFVQTMWSNAPTQTPSVVSAPPAGCLQRAGPTPDFTPPTGALHAQLAVSFDATNSYDIQAPITTYAWNFGDGSAVDTTSGATPHHVYAAPGPYTVTLTVGDATGQGNASSEQAPVTIGAAQPGHPTASFAPPAGATAGQPASFDAGSSSDPTSTISSYVWNFGDGTAPVSTASPTLSHTFSSAGTYTTSLTVHDLSGASSSTAHAVNVQAPPPAGHPTANFTPPAGATAGQPASFDAGSSSDATSTISSYVWNFGDGTAPVSTASPTLSHTFSSAGTYTTSLTVRDLSGASSSTAHAVNVQAPPAPAVPGPAPASPPNLGVSPVAGVTPSAPGANPHAGFATIGTFKIAGSSLAATISCAGDAGSSCTVVLSLSIGETLKGGRVIAVSAVNNGGKQHRRIGVGARRTLTLAAGQTKTIKLTLNATGKRLLARRRKLRVKLTTAQAGRVGASVVLSFKASPKKPRR